MSTAISHHRALAWMVLVTLLWSTAGVVTRWLDSAQSLEITFWRSVSCALALAVALSWAGRGEGMSLGRKLRRAPGVVWFSGLCWAVMFTAFMIALTLTSVANVLVTMALGPLITAVLARTLLGRQLPGRTWLAIGVAMLGILAMFGSDAGAGVSWLGSLVAGLVPLSGAANLILLQKVDQRRGQGSAEAPDMPLAVMLGGSLSALACLPLAWPLQASLHDILLLAWLGAFQLALPCVLMVRLSRRLPAPEIALLAQLEVIFGVAWAWLWAGETPSPGVLLGGSIVLAALIGNEALALRRAPR